MSFFNRIFRINQRSNSARVSNRLIDEKIAKLAHLLITNEGAFEKAAKDESALLDSTDLAYLTTKFHDPPRVHSDINEGELKLGQWIAVCQYAIFELFYNLDAYSLPLIEDIAFGEYDWTQATALEVLCRLFIDGRVSEQTVKEINIKMSRMRYETHLYLANSLLVRQKRDKRFGDIISKLDNESFQEALQELSEQ
jgi:hypothetical protein